MKAILTIVLCLAVCACRSDEKKAEANDDPMRAQRASKALSEAVIEEAVAEAQSKRDATSQHAATKYKIAAERLDKAKAEAKAAGMTNVEIQMKENEARSEALKQTHP